MKHDISAAQLRQAAQLREKIDALEAQLEKILGGNATTNGTAGSSRPKRYISPEGRARIAAAQKARWAAQGKGSAKTSAAKPAKGKMSPAAKANLSKKLKAIWAQRKAAQTKQK